MNTNDKIELPPNPITPMLAALIDKASGAGTAETIWQLMQEFANQAIEADRERNSRPRPNGQYFEGVNIERLRKALTAQGVAAPESLEELAATLARHINALTMQVADRQRRGEPVAEWWSNDDGDSWVEHPGDADFVDGLKVGDEYELRASVSTWTERFRVIKAPDDISDDYEVELLPNPSTPQPAEPVSEVGDFELRGMWYGAGGTFHGPNIETATMPEAKLLPFLRGLLSRRQSADPVKVPSDQQPLLDMLERLCTGLEWNIENHPEAMTQADDEALSEARALLERYVPK